ncbi:MAG: hypothetical protein ACYTEL_14365 [Planctomycetota bacterium]
MKTLLNCTIVLLFGCLICCDATSKAAQETDSELLRVYEVNKSVRDFPKKEDFSTPEATYAVINRVMAGGRQGDWRRISTAKTANRLPPADAQTMEVKTEVAKMWLNARILEVRVFRGRHAIVIARVKREGKTPLFDGRIVDLENGKWLNTGQSVYKSLDQARSTFAGSCAEYVEKPVRPKIDDPDAYLQLFVDFLKMNAQDPKQFVMRALAKHKVVIMGEIHHRPRYWAFNSSLVADPDFAERIGVIYLELPANDQDLVDKFLADSDCNTLPVIRMLRDNLWMGWPDQPMLDFFIKVWMVNQGLPPGQRIRIVLVDMQRPWSQIQQRNDWAKYERVNRDRQMADNILADLRQHAQDKRNAFFIVGGGHAMLNFKYFEGSPVTSAGWYLRNELGPDKVYAILQHRCVMTNWGRVDGRLCMGLFESAFAEIGDKPMAFTLDNGPFGAQSFDASGDLPVNSTYRDGYNAYLYLGPLETEIFSPLIAGFYSDEFVKELDRRYRIMYGKSLVEGCHLPALDAESFIAWMRSWGRPRKWSKNLGPLTAWHRGGSDWKQTIRQLMYSRALGGPEHLNAAATELFDAIRAADYDNPDDWKDFIPVEYCVLTNYPGWVRWMCETFKTNPIESVELGRVFKSDTKAFYGGKPGLPAIEYKLTLKDGAILEGSLPFDYDAKQRSWMGMHGLDWHLKR